MYYATKFLGEPCETDEMAPTWFSVADIPYGEWLISVFLSSTDGHCKVSFESS